MERFCHPGDFLNDKSNCIILSKVTNDVIAHTVYIFSMRIVHYLINS